MIPLFKPYMKANVAEYVMPVLSYDANNNMYLGQGKKVDEFEEAFRKLCDLPHKAVALNSGTAALELACQLIGIQPGDEVITTPITCTATQTGIFLYGAIPVWADVDKYTGLIDPYSVAQKITPKTKAIIGVNWGGRSPEYTKLKSFGIPVIEDAAHGPYSTSYSRGDYIVWSTQAIKFLTTGDGGFLYTPTRDLQRAKLLRWYGLDRESKADFRCEQDITEIGRKLHMNDLNAAIGLANIEDVNTLTSAHNYNAYVYTEHLRNSKVQIPEYRVEYPFWIYTVLVENPSIFIEYLKSHGIAASPVHARNDKHTAFKRVTDTHELNHGALPGVDYFDAHQVSIPVGWWLSEQDIEHIIRVINAY